MQEPGVQRPWGRHTWSVLRTSVLEAPQARGVLHPGVLERAEPGHGSLGSWAHTLDAFLTPRRELA